ncbi:hypothetical protein ACYATP_07245 [Lactobacillaceae bacterium Melli_B4]
MQHPLFRILFSIVDIQNFLLLIFLFFNIGFQSRNKNQEVQSDGLSNFILILALCESLNFVGNAIMKDWFLGARHLGMIIGISVIVISWIVAIIFTIWNFNYLKKFKQK